MKNLMRSRHLQMSFNGIVLTLIVAMSLAWLPAQAAPLLQDSSCKISVKAGWSPHRVEAGDTLASLAARGAVTVEELMQVNCLASESIEVGSLVLTPKLGPVLPTATPTAIPTEVPTATPTTEPTPTKPVVVIVEESSPAATEGAAMEENGTGTEGNEADTADNTVDGSVTATPANEVTDLSGETSEGDTSAGETSTDSTDDASSIVVVEPTATVTATAVAEEEAEETPVAVSGGGTTTPPSFPLGTSGLVGLSLFIMGSVSALFFALQPRKPRPVYNLDEKSSSNDSPAMGGMFINIAFMIGGFVIGAMLFPMLRMPGFVELPTWLSASAAIGLIGLLAVKEVLLGAVQWRGLNRVLNLGIAPLLMIFVLSVVSRFAGMGN